MARIFITGSTDGLGRADAQTLIDGGHQVVLHARFRDRASALDDLGSRSAGMITGDLRTDGEAPAKEVTEPVFQDQLSARLAELSGVSLF